MMHAACALKGAAAMTGATIVGWATQSLIHVVMDVAMSGETGGAAGVSLFLAVASIPFWILGALFIATPVWAWLHRQGARSRRDAVTAGAIAVGLASPLPWIVMAPDLTAMPVLVAMALIGALSGGVAGLALHSSFYRRLPVRRMEGNGRPDALP
jgi:hypothetical protein